MVHFLVSRRNQVYRESRVNCGFGSKKVSMEQARLKKGLGAKCSEHENTIGQGENGF